MTNAETGPTDRRSGRPTDTGAARPAGTGELRRLLRHADLRAVAESRAALRLRLAEWGLSGLRDTAELLLSEVVTNALTHTPDTALLTVSLTRGARTRLHVEVEDGLARRPCPRPAGDEATGGRGLLILRALADDWGVRMLAGGKAVWFELDA